MHSRPREEPPGGGRCSCSVTAADGNCGRIFFSVGWRPFRRQESPVQHVVSRPTPPFRVTGTELWVHQIPSWQDNFIWLLTTPEGEAAAIDGPEADTVLQYCAERHLRLTTVLNTHTHPDHIGLNRGLARRGRLDEMRVVGAASRADDIPGLNQ